MGLRHRGEETAVGTRYRMRQRLLAIGDDYWIETEDGTRAFHVDGKALRLRKTFVLEDTAGNEVAKLQERKLSVRDKMEIERHGETLATVKSTRWAAGTDPALSSGPAAVRRAAWPSGPRTPRRSARLAGVALRAA